MMLCSVLAFTIAVKFSLPMRLVQHKLKDGRTVLAYMYPGHDKIRGEIRITPAVQGQGGMAQLDGINIQLGIVSQFEMLSDHTKDHQSIVSVGQTVGAPTQSHNIRKYRFEFLNVKIPQDTYSGEKVMQRYILRVRVTTAAGSSVMKDEEIVVRNCIPVPPVNNPIKIPIQLESKIYGEVELDKDSYHLKDVITGEVHFHRLGRLMIRTMHVELYRKVSIDPEPDVVTTVANVMLMYSDPRLTAGVIGNILSYCCWNMDEGRSFPISIPLSNIELTPTYNNNDRFSVTYYLKVFVDAENIGPLVTDNQEITLYRIQDNTMPRYSFS